MRSLRLALRTLFKSPFVTTVAILSLALGIGANAAMYSMFDQILLSPLPVQHAGRLVNISAPGPKPGSQTCNQAGDCDVVLSYPMYRDLEKAEIKGLTGIAAHRLFSANVAIRGQTLNGDGVQVSGSYFPLLGLRPTQGRLFGPADDETIGGHPIAVLSHNFWEMRLGSDPGVVGQTIIVNGQSFEIVGVAPKGFKGTTLGPSPLLFVPMTMRGVLQPTFTGFDNRRNYWVYAFGRLAPNATIEQVSASMNGVYKPIVNDVEAPLQEGMSDATLAQFRAKNLLLEDGRRGQSSVHREAKTPLLMLFGTAAIVLLIACANIANLLLARGANRGMEMAVRLSLGASRRQVVQQLLLESVVLAALGSLVGLIVGRWTLAGIGALLPPEAATMFNLRISWPMVGFAAVLAVATGVIFGLFPALHSTRSDLVTTIRSNAGNLSVTRAAARFRATLVTAQIALSMTLLITAGLFIRSLNNVSRVDLGLKTENVVTFAISPRLNGYEPARVHQIFADVEEQLAAIPGVTGVSTGLVAVLSGSNWGNTIRVEGFQSGPDVDSNARFNEVGPNYFATLGIPLLAGREFTVNDNQGTPDVAIVNEAFVRKFNLGNDVIGKRMSADGDDELEVEIIGLVKDAKYSEVKDEIPPLYFFPWRQDERIGSITLYVRAGTDPAQIMRSIPPLMARIDPNLPIEEFKTLPQQVRESIFLERMIGIMSASFAGLATLLAAIGLYGVLAYTVTSRTREIGVRMALGASSGNVRGMVLRQVMIMLIIGGVIGLPAALGIGKAASSMLFGVEGSDPLVMLMASVVLVLFAFAAGYIPAERASRVEPIRALRYE